MLALLTGCTFSRAPLGSEKNPVKLYFVPAVDARMIADRSKVVKDYLERVTPYKFTVAIPASYIAVVEAFGTDRADVSGLNTFGYILANEKYGAEARLTSLRHGRPSYRGQIIAKEGGAIQSLKDIDGKRFAYVDPSSTSGYLLPAKLFRDRGIKPGKVVFASKHDNVITQVYQGQVDAGATFYSPPEGGEIQDARRLVRTQFPDVEKKIKIIELTDEIPNDPIVFRKDLPLEMKEKITSAFLSFMKTEEGQKSFQDIYGITDLKEIRDKDYDGVREMLKSLGQSAAKLVK